MNATEVLALTIDNALLDGKLDVQERILLSSRAREMQISEEILQSLINERWRASQSQGAICVRCGKPIANTLSTKCLCKASLAEQRKSWAIEELNQQLLAAPTNDHRLLVIKSFPLPTAQNDIVASLSLAASALVAESDVRSSAIGLDGILMSIGLKDEDPVVKQARTEIIVWKSKASAIIDNARILYSDDSEFLKILGGFQARFDSYEKEQKKQRQLRLLILFPVALFGLAVMNPKIFLAIPSEFQYGTILYKLFSELQPILTGLFWGAILGVIFGWLKKRGAEATQQKASADVLTQTLPGTTERGSLPTSGIRSANAQVDVPTPQPVERSFANITKKEHSTKSKTLAIILCLFLGLFGVHRFYVGKYGTGILMWLTTGGFFLWWIADLFALMTTSFTDSKGRPLV
jgi:TM2 domain-containing membrane protein YozV